MLLYNQPVFTPASLPKPFTWLDASVTPVGTVSTWTDQFGLGNSPTAAGSARPTCTANQKNGLNGLVFDGSANLLTLTSSFFTVPAGDNTMFAVAKRNVASGNQFILDMNIGSAPAQESYLMQYANTAGNILFQNRSLNSSAVTSTGNTTTNYNVMTGFRAGITTSLSINGGAAVTNSNALSVTTIDGGAIGGRDEGTSLLAGVILEIIIYKYALSASEVIAVNRYLGQKWAITVA